MSSDETVSRPPLPEGRQHRPRIGEWNYLELAIGKRGAGKTTALLERMLDLDEQAGGSYMIGHSLGARLDPHLPSGRRLELHYYESITKLDSGLRRRPEALHVHISDDAQELLDYGFKLAAAVRKRALPMFSRNRSPIGREAPPVDILVDELVALDAATGSAQGGKGSRGFRKFLISLRHNHIGLLAGVQDANAVSYINAGLATKLHCFNMSHDWAIQSLKAAGLKEAEGLPNYAIGEFITVDLTLKPAK
jgi:hypothetical protein